MGAAGIHPMAVDNSWQYRPQESPANGLIEDYAGDAVDGVCGFLHVKGQGALAR
jgi:hypothetical protein